MPVPGTIHDPNKDISLLDVHDNINNLTHLVEKHIEIEEIRRTQESQRQDMQRQEIINKLERNISHTDHLQEHFDERLLVCHAEVKTMMKRDHYTKDEARQETTKAIQASQLRQFAKLKLIGWVVVTIVSVIGFMSQYGSVILHILKGNNNG